MAKRTNKKSTTKRNSSKAKKKKEVIEAAPTMHFLESSLMNLFDSDVEAPDFTAQQHAYDAMEAMAEGDYDAAELAAVLAIEIDPNCIDAMHILSQLSSDDELELIDSLRYTLERAELALGKKFFRENEGYFWGLLETRPYMRVKAELAQLLYQEGEAGEAIEHVEEMLKLNPNDNQGLRYLLAGWYLETDKLEEATRLFRAYPEEGSPMFAWARILVCFLSNEPEKALELLVETRVKNQHVEPLMTGRKKLPKERPSFYGIGDANEAYVCFEEIGSAWKKHPAAIAWLKKQPKKK